MPSSDVWDIVRPFGIYILTHNSGAQKGATNLLKAFDVRLNGFYAVNPSQNKSLYVSKLFPVSEPFVFFDDRRDLLQDMKATFSHCHVMGSRSLNVGSKFPAVVTKAIVSDAIEQYRYMLEIAKGNRPAVPPAVTCLTTPSVVTPSVDHQLYYIFGATTASCTVSDYNENTNATIVGNWCIIQTTNPY